MACVRALYFVSLTTAHFDCLVRYVDDVIQRDNVMFKTIPSNAASMQEVVAQGAGLAAAFTNPLNDSYSPFN
jgi:hypothetical protein